MKNLILLLTLSSFLLISGCATTMNKTDNTAERQRFNKVFDSSDNTMSGYKYEEASEFIKFCIELNSQDDRNNHPSIPDPDPYQPKIDFDRWKVKFDSREAVAKARSEIKVDQKCTGDYKKILNDPVCNGFGPFQNAWILYKDTHDKTESGTYVIAIRGTVIENKKTLKQDVLATTIPANDGMKFKGDTVASVRFADLSEAEIHAGFSYGTFITLFDNDYGILKQLEEKGVKPGAKIYIVGHSLGAAMATLTHAFLHYAMRDDKFGLKDKNYKLKSYAFAQPKPGNHIFSMDFANITHLHNNAIVINNTLDPVPKVPFTFELTSDWATGIQGKGFWISLVHGLANAGMGLRKLFSSSVEDEISKKYDLNTFYLKNELKSNTKFKSGVSLNYVSAGLIIPLDGHVVSKECQPAYIGQPNDPFIQHHAPTYQQLIEERLAKSK